MADANVYRKALQGTTATPMVFKTANLCCDMKENTKTVDKLSDKMIMMIIMISWVFRGF